jgi:hypothetical protein
MRALQKLQGNAHNLLYPMEHTKGDLLGLVFHDLSSLTVLSSLIPIFVGLPCCFSASSLLSQRPLVSL